MAMAARKGGTAVARGARFERTCQRALRDIGMTLNAVGGAGDRGVDLAGRWDLGAETRVGVIVQCKSSAARRKVGPTVVRGLVGSARPAHALQDRLVTLVAIDSEFTKAMEGEFMRAREPMALVQFSCPECKNVERIAFNRELSRQVPGLAVSRQHRDGGPFSVWHGQNLVGQLEAPGGSSE